MYFFLCLKILKISRNDPKPNQLVEMFGRVREILLMEVNLAEAYVAVPCHLINVELK